MDSRKSGVCCFEKGVFVRQQIEKTCLTECAGQSLKGFDSRDFPALTKYREAAESSSGGKGARDKIKTVGMGRIIEADRSGGRDGLIGDKGET